jgi:hypothetical protein
MLRERPRLFAGALLAVLLAAILLALTPAFLVLGLLHDASAPAEIANVLPAAKGAVEQQTWIQVAGGLLPANGDRDSYLGQPAGTSLRVPRLPIHHGVECSSRLSLQADRPD